MSFATWTPVELSSNFVVLKGECWRLVEAQHIVSTTKLSDTAEEQDILEDLIEKTKPRVPDGYQKLDYLIQAPFRYGPYPHGSRFRRAGHAAGVYYAGEAPETAVAEMAFYRILFFAESPATPWPSNAAEFTAFSVPYRTQAALDLTRPPFDTYAAQWRHPVEYEACQAFEEAARKASAELIRFVSVRDPHHGCNLAILTGSAFTRTSVLNRQTWRIHLSHAGARAVREFARVTLSFDQTTFASDPRLAGMTWAR